MAGMTTAALWFPRTLGSDARLALATGVGGFGNTVPASPAHLF